MTAYNVFIDLYMSFLLNFLIVKLEILNEIFQKHILIEH